MTEGRYVTEGVVPYINLKDVTLREALKALLRPLNLDFSVQPSLIWISTPDNIRHESFEELETRYYELRNAGAETLFKIVLRNPGGGGGGGGGYGGGGFGGGGFGGGGLGGGGYGGQGFGGGGFGGGGGITIQNISQLFGSISDSQVGETPAIVGTAGISGISSAGTGAASYDAYSGGGAGATGQAGLGTAAGRAQTVSGDDPEIVRLLRTLIDDVYEPGGTEPISRIIYVPHTNQLIVHNTPTNLARLEVQLTELDITPKQVSIEAKFLTIKNEDLDKTGFKWNMSYSDQNSRNQQIPSLVNTTYSYDLNADGTPESIPFYQKPSGANVITNTITEGVLDAVSSPGPPGTFSLSGVLTANEDGDKISVVFDYLNSLEETELLSAPRVTTMNRKPAVIVDLSSEYFVSQVRTQVTTTEAGFGGTSALGYTQEVTPTQFNFGITLSVTPQISGGDQVRLWLNPQVTTRGLEKKFTQRSVIGGVELTSEITLPNTSTQAVWSNVIVHDGDTLVLGGLVVDATIKGVQKMPYLADIPLLGFFFRGKHKQTKQSSLLIFVTPQIIDTTGARFFEPYTTASTPMRSTPSRAPTRPSSEYGGATP